MAKRPAQHDHASGMPIPGSRRAMPRSSESAPHPRNPSCQENVPALPARQQCTSQDDIDRHRIPHPHRILKRISKTRKSRKANIPRCIRFTGNQPKCVGSRSSLRIQAEGGMKIRHQPGSLDAAWISLESMGIQREPMGIQWGVKIQGESRSMLTACSSVQRRPS